MFVGGAAAQAQLQLHRYQAATIAKRKTRSLTAEALVSQYRELLDSLTPVQIASLREEFLSFGKTEPGFLTAKELRPVRDGEDGEVG